MTDPSGRAVSGVSLWLQFFLNCRFESRRGHGCLSLVIVVRCQEGVSASFGPLVHSPTVCGREASIMRRSWPSPACCAVYRKLLSCCSPTISNCAPKSCHVTSDHIKLCSSHVTSPPTISNCAPVMSRHLRPYQIVLQSCHVTSDRIKLCSSHVTSPQTVSNCAPVMSRHLRLSPFGSSLRHCYVFYPIFYPKHVSIRTVNYHHVTYALISQV